MLTAVLACVVALSGGCTDGQEKTGDKQAAERAFAPQFHDAAFDAQAAEGDQDAAIDLSHASDGYIAAAARANERMKLQVSCGDQSYNYDLPNTGDPIVVPANMGDGDYTVRIMLNTTGERYVERLSAHAKVVLSDENAPYLRPNLFCNYTKDSACVQLANQLCAGAATESEAFDAVYEYISGHISYDFAKADALADVTGYVPQPDETLESGTGICFDYASLTAAMLRSQGIATKVLTGYVAPDNVYHAWDMIYIDGSWVSLHISARPGQWARADMTFAANGAEELVGEASAYADRYTY